MKGGEEEGEGPPISLSMKRQGILTALNHSHLSLSIARQICAHCNYFELRLFPWWPVHSGRQWEGKHKIFRPDFELFLSHFWIVISWAAAFRFCSCSFGSLKVLGLFGAQRWLNVKADWKRQWWIPGNNRGKGPHPPRGHWGVRWVTAKGGGDWYRYLLPGWS